MNQFETRDFAVPILKDPTQKQYSHTEATDIFVELCSLLQIHLMCMNCMN